MPGLKFSVLGDSISTFEGVTPQGFTLFYSGEQIEASGVKTPADTWWAHVIKALGGTLLRDNAWSGSMVEGAGFPAASSRERVEALLGPAGDAPDVVITFIGINDFGWGGAAAQAAGRGHATPAATNLADFPQAVAKDAPADAAQLFGRAYRQMLQHIHAVAPNALVYCVTLLPGRTRGVDHSQFTYRLRSIHLDAYNEAIREAARTEGCRIADVREFARDYDSLEGTHPTALGMRQFASMVVHAMQLADEQLPDAPGATAATVPQKANPAIDIHDFCGAPESSEDCRKPTCVGCPYAADTGNQWLCRCLK